MSGPQIVLTMTSGKKITIQTNQKESPKTVKYIQDLCAKKFYTGIRFHRIEDWVIQWGDPLTKKSMTDPGIGGGGTGKSMPFEASKHSFTRGVVGIASTGAKVGGDCQIFILTKDAKHLDGRYAVLGRVTQGMDVADKMKIGDKIKSMVLWTPKK
jgi:cyclophilin family peptidyl-prolyl cis-trans isomerase